MHDDSPIRSLTAWRRGTVVIVQFEGSVALTRVLRARGVQVCVLASLAAAIEVLNALPEAVLVVRFGMETTDGEDAITLVVRNFGTLGILRAAGAAESFHDRFAQFFSGYVDTQTLGAAVMHHAGLLTDTAAPVRRGVA